MSVIAAFELDDEVASGRRAGQPHGRHRRLRPAVHEPHHLETRHAPPHFFGELDLGLARRAVRPAALCRLADCLEYGGVRVTEDQRPPRTDVVDVALAVGVFGPTPGGRADHHRERGVRDRHEARERALGNGVRRRLEILPEQEEPHAVPTRLADAREVDHAERTLGRAERGLEDVGIEQVALRTQVVAVGSNREFAPIVTIEQRSEHRRRIEAREAAPGHRTVGTDQCRVLAIAYESKVLEAHCGNRSLDGLACKCVADSSAAEARAGDESCHGPHAVVGPVLAPALPRDAVIAGMRAALLRRSPTTRRASS